MAMLILHRSNPDTMPLPRRVLLPDSPKVNVWDIATKQIVYTGDTQGAGTFMGIQSRRVMEAVKRKSRIQNKWAVRPVKSS